MDGDAGDVLPAIASWAQHICYVAEAVSVLFTNGYCQAAHPLLRQIFEHSVAVAVVANSPARYEEYFKDTWSGLRRVGEERDAVGLDHYPDAAAFLAAAEEPTSKHTSTKARFQSLGDDGQRLDLSWLADR
ncbi:DUF5677 domain-containing protein [Jiangella mangrovi]|uniref:Uncharacterized protein n=1 Tax=Jiangella mangrovi TaxID=1524084 RepID=A0A7W9GUM2_9ACTN|nr:hypothetical protein [Jiangella mangrovi]